jgi:hypothetical protein
MLALLFATLTQPLLAMNACADPAITHVAAGPAGSNGNLTTFDFAITLKNIGSGNQPSSTLNSVRIYQDATKVDQKGAAPLRAGGTETVTYHFQRSAQAQHGSTHLRFVLTVADPHKPATDCSTANDSARIDI